MTATHTARELEQAQPTTYDRTEAQEIAGILASTPPDSIVELCWRAARMMRVMEARIAELETANMRLSCWITGQRALLISGCEILSAESDALRAGISINGEVSATPEDALTIAAITEIEDWIASVKATVYPARAALISEGEA